MSSQQSGITVTKAGEPFTVVHDLTRSTPGPKQALVKTVCVALNPVETIMQKYGALVHDWPGVLGSDYCAQVIETGSDCTRLKKGDLVYGESHLGQKLYSPFQDTFLVGDDTAFKKNEQLTPEQAATIGVGTLTASFGVIVGANVSLPEDGKPEPQRDEWLVVLGGSGTVGHYAIQIARLCGYKVAASCSPSKNSVVVAAGATTAFNGRGTPDEQAAAVKSITGGHFSAVFDASALSHEAAGKILDQSTASAKHFSTSDITPREMGKDVSSYNVEIGLLGQENVEKGKQVTNSTRKMIPLLEKAVDSGALTPLEYQLYEGSGWDALVKALDEYGEGKLTQKTVVRA